MNVSSIELTALENCLLNVAKTLERPLTLAALHAGLSGATDSLTVRDVLDTARRGGLLAAFGARQLNAFDAALAPAILLLEGDRAVVYHGRTDNGDLLIFDPDLGEGSGEVRESELRKVYSGYAILFRREHTERSDAADNGHRGHWLWSALSANRWSYFQVALAAAVANLLGLSTSVFIMIVYDRVLPNGATESLIALTIGVGLALIFDFMLKFLRAGFIDRAGQFADMTIGRRVFDQLLNIRLDSRVGSTGATASTVREFETLREFFTSATLAAVVDLPFVLIFVGAIYLIAGPLAFVPALAVPIVLLTGMAVQPFLSRLAERSFTEGQSKQTVLVEAMTGLETIKTTAAGRNMRNRWCEALERQSSHSKSSRAITQFALNLTGFVQQTAQVLVVFYGVFLVTAGTTSMGALVAAVMLTGRALAPMGQLAQTLTRVNQARSAYRNLDRLMNAQNERPDNRSWVNRPQLSGRITFNNVYFSYPEQSEDALKGLTFSIEPGEKVAILGQIGSGKSTIARLLLGLYQPRVGSVMVDGLDIRQIDPGDLRRNIGTVMQDIWLFSGSIRDNITSGTINAKDDDLIRAGRISGVEDFVSRHPSGYDLCLAERGEGLSGGQRQAIALARALIGRPPIILLDEPTSAMDVRSETEIIRRLKAAGEDTTMMVVTHRTSLLELVDRIIVIEDGKVGADGPKSLLSQHIRKSGRHLNVAAS